MLQAIVDWSIRNRFVVVILAVILLLVGLYATTRAKLDVFPEFAPPQVDIQTEAPGLSAIEVEQLVTLPIEAVVNGIPHLDVLRSKSIQGLSVITIVFLDRTDVYRARQLVTERLAELAGQLPSGVKAPRLAPLTAATGRLLTIGFTSDTISPMDLRDRVQWLVRPRLLAVPGVAQATLYGGEVRQFQVQVHPDALVARNLTLTDILEAARQASGIRGAGFLENSNQRVTLRVEGQIRSPAELGETVLTSAEGTPVRLKDVALVTEGAEPKFGDASINGRPGVILVASKQLGGDTMDITRRVEEELAKFKPILDKEDIVAHSALFRQASFVEAAVGNVTHSLLIGAALVAIVLFAFLFNLRTAFISLTAIPLSLLSAIILLWLWDVGLNTLTLGGLAIAVGEVVDDAIIDVENIYRRLRENARLGYPKSSTAVVLSASLEVRGAVVYATFIVVLVFVPIFFLSGLHGRLFAPLGYAYVLAVLASLAVALTVTPALALLLLPRAGGALEPPLLRRLQGGYDWFLRRLDHELPLVLVTTLALVAGAIGVLVQFGGSFLPELRENHLVVHMRGSAGTSLAQSIVTGNQITHYLRQDANVLSVAQQAGRAELGEDTEGVEYSELEVDLKKLSGNDAGQMEDNLKEHVAGFSFEALSFLSERIKETLSGTRAALAVKVYGDDLPALDQFAQEVARTLGSIPGWDGKPAARNVRVEQQTGSPELVVRARSEDAARRGLRNAQILDTIHAAYHGAEVGQVFERNRIIDLTVILDARARADLDTVANLWLNTPTGRVQLKQVADVYLSDGRFLIAHEGGMRRQVVTCNVGDNLDPESFATQAERLLKDIRLPAGTNYVLTGEHEAQRTARYEVGLLSLLSLVGILLLLGTVFQSLRRLLLLLVNLPFALVGGVAAVYLAGGILNVGSLIGFVTLFGITMRNGIMMVAHWQHLHEVEGVPWGRELVFRGARERLAPVLMTALVTGFGLLPIALGSGDAGREVEGPMAWVILGGLVTSTGLNLIVLPVLYRRFGEPAALAASP
jgi:CzcA family heavy metal efflux pump